MFEIISKKQITDNEFDITVSAPRIANHAKAGQFVVLRVSDTGERIPLTIADYDIEAGTIRLIFQVVGKSTALLSGLNAGDSITDVAGPLGMPSEIENYGTVLMVGGGVGIAALFPIIKALKKAGNKVITILGGRDKDLIILQKECKEYSDEVIFTTNDGSLGMKGLVTDAMQLVAERKEQKIDKCWAIGPSIMMKFCATKCRELALPCVVSLNPLMVDGTAMCGCCRVTVGDKIFFACVDGPEFDGLAVDWDEFLARSKQYKDEETLSFNNYKEGK